MNVVDSNCSRKHFSSEKYTILQSFNLYFLLNSPVLQLYTSDSDCNFAGNIPGSPFIKTFSALSSHS